MNMTVPATVDPVAIIQSIFQRARLQQLSLSELLQTVEKLTVGGATAPALDLYRTWIAFNDKNPLVHVASFNYAVLLNQTGDTTGAIQALQATIASKADFAQAHINLGRLYEDCQLIGRAVQQWRDFVATSEDITPERLNFRLMALKHMGRVLEGAGLLEEAETILWLAMELDPTKHDAPQHWLALRQQQCKWPIISHSEYITRSHLTDAMSPMTIACYADDPCSSWARLIAMERSLWGGLTLRTCPVARSARRLRLESASASVTCRRICVNMRWVLRFAKCLNCTTRARSKSTPTTAVSRAQTTGRMIVFAPLSTAGVISTP